jgi:hypothetical protein
MKPAGIAGIFVAGVIAGVVIMRATTPDSSMSTLAGPVAERAPASNESEPSYNLPPPQAAPRAAIATPEKLARTSVDPAPIAPSSDDRVATSRVPPAAVSEALSFEFGPDLAASIAEQESEEGSAGKLHVALEAEARDDTWAYAAETRLQNSLVNEVGSGKFTLNHMECRATLCEVHLSGSDTQSRAMQDWTNEISKQNWSTEMAMTAQSSVTNQGKTESLLILRRVPPAAKAVADH